VLFGAGLARDGSRAIRDQAYTLHYTERTSWAFGPAWGGSWVREGAVEYRGRAATLFGVGFAATGTMWLAWAAGLVLSLLGRAGLHAPRAVLRAVGAVALAALLVGCVALFPPWRLHTLPLYLVVAAFTLAVTLPIPDRLRKKVFPAAVVLVIVVGMTSFPAFPIFAGIFVFLIAGTNLLLLWPGLWARVERSQSGAR
jgi:MFS family permease